MKLLASILGANVLVWAAAMLCLVPVALCPPLGLALLVVAVVIALNR